MSRVVAGKFQPNVRTINVAGAGCTVTIYPTDDVIDLTTSTAGTTVTTLQGGTRGQFVTVKIGIGGPGTLQLAVAPLVWPNITFGGLMLDGDKFTFLVEDTPGANYRVVDGNVGMGNKLVFVDPEDAVGTPRSAATNTYGDVDVSGDGVRKGALAVLINFYIVQGNTVEVVGAARKKGSSDDRWLFRTGSAVSGYSWIDQYWIPVNLNAVFEFKWNAAWTASSNLWYVKAYII